MSNETYETFIAPYHRQVLDECGTYEALAGYNVFCETMSECGKYRNILRHFQLFDVYSDAVSFAEKVKNHRTIRPEYWECVCTKEINAVPYWGTPEFAHREQMGTL